MFRHARGRLHHLRLIWDLEEARWDYNLGHYQAAAERLFKVIDEVVIEPHPDSEEYKNGERKLEEKEFTEEEEGTIDGPTAEEPERDEYGYLIR